MTETDSERPGDGFVYIAAGQFIMGDRIGSGLKYERPTRMVSVSAFYMAPYEVQIGDWNKAIGKTPASFSDTGFEHPVEFSTWFEAILYCNALSHISGFSPSYEVQGTNVRWIRESDGYRLPTEAEWEYAARGGVRDNNRRYAGHDNARLAAVFDSAAPATTGMKAANELGLYDMSGNVAEWCWDWFGAYEEQALMQDPEGPSHGEERVLRGGSWYGSLSSITVSARGSANPLNRLRGVGFRPVRSAFASAGNQPSAK